MLPRANDLDRWPGLRQNGAATLNSREVRPDANGIK